MRGGKIAEIGCGAGEILNELTRFLPDCRCEGFDISPHAITLAQPRSHSRLSFRVADFSQTPKEVRYDVVLVMDVIEHVEDYFGFLRAIRGRATHYIFHIPLDLSCQTVLREAHMVARKEVGHLQYFTKESALATLTDTGYDVVDHFYTPSHELILNRRLPHHILDAIRRLAFPIAPDLAVRVFGGYSLLVLAR